jgi:hypothetical protein
MARLQNLAAVAAAASLAGCAVTAPPDRTPQAQAARIALPPECKMEAAPNGGVRCQWLYDPNHSIAIVVNDSLQPAAERFFGSDPPTYATAKAEGPGFWERGLRSQALLEVIETETHATRITANSFEPLPASALPRGAHGCGRFDFDAVTTGPRGEQALSLVRTLTCERWIEETGMIQRARVQIAESRLAGTPASIDFESWVDSVFRSLSFP